MLSTLTSKANIRRPAWVSSDPLNVSPDLVGAPLATPMRRGLAIGIDLAVIAVLSDLDGFWLGAALVVFLYQMRSQEPGKRTWRRNAWLWAMCALCLWLAAERGWQSWTAHNRPAVASTIVGTATTPLPASAPVSSPAEAEEKPAQTDAERIEDLEDQLVEARKPHAFRWQSELKKWWGELGVGFGWAMVYFALVPAWLHGQTLGKKLLRLRTVELTGKPLTVRICFSRYGGYAAGMATGMFGFAQILWDDNRQAIQDKVAHTVVIDLQAPFKTPEMPAPAQVPLPHSEPEVVHQIAP
jgi:uncharacterized RDD family membrane protein YckC